MQEPAARRLPPVRRDDQLSPASHVRRQFFVSHLVTDVPLSMLVGMGALGTAMSARPHDKALGGREYEAESATSTARFGTVKPTVYGEIASLRGRRLLHWCG